MLAKHHPELKEDTVQKEKRPLSHIYTGRKQAKKTVGLQTHGISFMEKKK